MVRPLELLLDLLYPPRCAFCGALLDSGRAGLCPACRRDLPWLSGPEAEQSGADLSFTLCVSPLRYQGKVREAIHRYKFEGCPGRAAAFGPLIARCVSEHLAGQYDRITWAPLSPKRKRKRGYDQAYLLARAAAKELGTAPVGLLRKVRHTAAQSGLSEAGDRRANVKGAYEVPDPALVQGKRILLIDDVVTTGSTLSECAGALREAGAEAVVCAALARAH